jgi:hypothetical protein
MIAMSVSVKVLGIGQGYQTFTLGGGKHRTTGHDAPLENAGF